MLGNKQFVTADGFSKELVRKNPTNTMCQIEVPYKTGQFERMKQNIFIHERQIFQFKFISQQNNA